MIKPIIEIHNLSKAYNISHESKAGAGTVTLRDAIVGVLKKPSEILTGRRLKKEKFWALKDVSLDIQPGDVVGLIGKNGSGKSTMLKILSRIVEPTEGKIIMRGSAASLLEVGTGFHPELTGRENIYFNGSILGMKKKEIDAKFDEIVKFSGVEKFLDTPVKFYSSGMYVRLAFAVAAHLEPDVLIVDEVLAVGDAEFQKKSLGKMRDVTRDKSRTVIFVSHSMDAIQSICNKCIWLQEGQIVKSGEVSEVVDAYMHSATQADNKPIAERKDRQGTQRVKCEDVKVTNRIIEDRSIDLKIVANNSSKDTFGETKLSIDVYDQSGIHVGSLVNYLNNSKLKLKPGQNIIDVSIDNINLVPGIYSLNIFLASDQYNTEIFDWIEGAVSVSIPAYDYYNSGFTPDFKGKYVYFDYSMKQGG